jgi:LuxR family maltose regulon positive regulatory protein
MSTPLLETKLYVPPVRQEFVSRPRLLEQLDLGLERRLILISAPAGFGKTTLLSEWIARNGQPVAWVSLDKDDNDPARFWAYVVAALQTVVPALGNELPAGSDARQPPSWDTWLPLLINQISALPRERSLILVLDDYHLIENRSLHKSLAFLVDHQPPQMHLVIASRADPPLSLPRLRGSGQLIELRQHELRFTLEEAAAFLNKVLGLPLSLEDVAALDRRTEGWIAGLQMASISMQARLQAPDRQDLSGFIASFSGSHRFVLDYLVEEVLEQQTAAVRGFLLRTSILDQLTGALCDALLQGGDSLQEWAGTVPLPSSQQVLEQLDAANLFIVSLDEERVWYRYHRLFSDLLQRRLAQSLPDQVPALHLRASHWYQEAGLAGKAIDHALAAGEVDRAATLIEAEAEATLMRSEVTTFLEWVEQLPAEEVRARPTLVLLHAGALLLAGRSLDAVAVRMRDVETYQELMPGPVMALLSYYEMLRGQVPQVAALAIQALRELPGEDLLWRSLATFSLSIYQLAAGELEASSRALDEIVRMGRETGNTLMAVGALIYLALFSIRRADLHGAQKVYELALDLASDGQAGFLPIAGEALVGLGNLRREWNDLEAATRYLQDGIELAQDWSAWGVVDGLVALAQVKQAQGDAAGASRAMQKAARLAAQSDVTDLDDLYVGMHQARLWVAQGNLDAAKRWAEERGLRDHSGTERPGPAERQSRGADGAGHTAGRGALQGRMLKYERLVLARLLLKSGQPGECLAVLDPLLAEMERTQRRDLALQCQVLRAVALEAQGKHAQAMVAFERALSLGTPGGYVRVFVDEGEPVTRLLSKAASRGVAGAYVEKLLAACDTATPGDGEDRPSPPVQPLVEPLSARELQVLRLLAAGLSNPEIAEQLVIAVSTVRSHLKNIYGKLDVHRRWDAVRRAKDLGLLD